MADRFDRPAPPEDEKKERPTPPPKTAEPKEETPTPPHAEKD